MRTEHASLMQANSIQQQATAAQGLPKVAVLGKLNLSAESFLPSMSDDLPNITHTLARGCISACFFIAGAAGGIGQPLSMLLKM